MPSIPSLRRQFVVLLHSLQKRTHKAKIAKKETTIHFYGLYKRYNKTTTEAIIAYSRWCVNTLN